MQKDKRLNYKLYEDFVEKCITALAFYDVIEQCEKKENETEDETSKRIETCFKNLKDEYRLKFIEQQK